MTTVASEFNYDIFYICCKLFQLSTTKPIATQLASLISKVLIPMTISTGFGFAINSLFVESNNGCPGQMFINKRLPSTGVIP